jgi:hypothetical protein
MSAHSPIVSHADLRIWRAPDLTAIIEGDDPNQVMLFAIVDYRNGVSVAFAFNRDRYIGGELRETHFDPIALATTTTSIAR